MDEIVVSSWCWLGGMTTTVKSAVKSGFIVEYKAPHKLTLAHFRCILCPNRSPLELNRVINQARVPSPEEPPVQFENHAERLVAAVVAQTFSYIVKIIPLPERLPSFEIVDLEARLLATIGPHKHIVERAQRGSIARFFEEHRPTRQQKLAWACQATEAIAAIHCDINVNNLLLHDNLAVKLCDFQGRLLQPNGNVDKDGLARENIKSFTHRADPNYSDRITDIFALESTFYHIMRATSRFRTRILSMMRNKSS
ncbi:MAG: hypothetical protein Q9179_007928 [Wetmoreana sp. 5 TL-2023]